jgi:hypothetical protein
MFHLNLFPFRIEQRAHSPLLAAGLASEYKTNFFLSNGASPQLVAGSNEYGCSRKGIFLEMLFLSWNNWVFKGTYIFLL